MADWTAITGIVVSGVVGPSLGAWWATRRLEREHQHDVVLGDRSELRALLDEATRDLSRAGRYRGAVQSAFLSHGPHTAERASQTVEQFHDATRTADLHNARLALRLGAESPVAVAYDEAWKALADASTAVGLAYGPGGIDTPEAWERLNASDTAFIAAHAAFLEGAHRVAASQLLRRRS